MVANRPPTVAVKPTRFFRKAIAGSTDDGPRIPQMVALFRLPWKIGDGGYEPHGEIAVGLAIGPVIFDVSGEQSRRPVLTQARSYTAWTLKRHCGRLRLV